MDVVGFVVEDDELVNVAHDIAEVDFGVGCCDLAEEVVHAVFTGESRLGDGVGVDAVDVGEEDIAQGFRGVDFVLLVKFEVKVVPPVLSLRIRLAAGRGHRRRC